MALRPLLLSFPLRRQTVVGALLIVTILYIVYQFTFVAELNESSRQQQRGSKDVKESHQTQHKELNKEYHNVIEKHLGNRHRVEAHPKEIQKIQHKDRKTDIEVDGKKVNSDQFVCKSSRKIITADKVNDDYCDCPDGSDEPRTNACNNGRFTCLKHIKRYPQTIPSGWVNDGVCDCCDGSDEWKMKTLDEGPVLELQKKTGRYLSPCPDMCPGKM